MAIVGLVLTIGFLMFMCKLLKIDWFEHMIATLGMSTGVFLTGLLLLKICDPDSKSSALGNSIAFSLVSAVTFAFMPILLNVVVNSGPMNGFLLTLFLTVAFLLHHLLLQNDI